MFQNQRKLNMELELKRNLESMLHDKERQLEVEIKSRKEASNSNQQVNEKIYSLEKVVSLKRENEIRDKRYREGGYLIPESLKIKKSIFMPNGNKKQEIGFPL